MEAWSEVDPVSNLNLNGTKKRKIEEEKGHFLPILGISDRELS